MKKVITILTIIICFIETTNAQLLSTSNEVNPEYTKWIANQKLVQTSEIHSLGYKPLPFIIHTELPSSEKEKLHAEFVPASYDLRSLSGVTSVKNQGSCGSCWTFATMGSIESNWLLSGRGTYDLSEDNLNTCHSPFDWTPCDGGNSEMSAAYLMRGSGPISETDDPYSDAHTTIDCPSGLVTQGLVTSAWFLPTNDPDIIKNCIMQYGALATNMYWTSTSYNSANYTYYYSGTAGTTNHAVTLVGWDDTKVTAGGTGAWIIKNSWGSGWGEGGYFYIAYQDVEVNSSVTVFPDYVDDTTGDGVSTYSEGGWLGQIGYGTGTNSADALVKFTADGDVQVDKIGTAAVVAGTIISIEIYNSFNGSNSLTDLLGSISSQTCTYTGYYSLTLSTPIEINDGDNYYVKISYQTPSYGYPVPIEKAVTNYCTPSISSGIFWLKSAASTTWSSTDGYGWDPCVYVYTSPVSIVPENLAVTNTSYTSGTNECIDALDTITVAGDGNPVAILSNATVDFIAGRKISLLHGFHAYSGSYMSASITTTNGFCNLIQSTSSVLAENSYKSTPSDNNLTGNNILTIDKTVKIFPNPNKGRFTLELSNFEGTSSVTIMNTLGAVINKSTVSDERTSFDLPDLNKGLYFVIVKNGKKIKTCKMAVQ